jgi:DNA-directed RNA polymerase subunit RPC12/RpoP
MHALEVRRVPSSADLEKPGDFAFIKKREPILITTERPLPAPHGLWKRFFFHLWGKKVERTVTAEPLWPPRDTVIIICPSCSQPFATTDKHTIVSLEPLSIKPDLACPYCRTQSFFIEEGKIIPVVFHAA